MVKKEKWFCETEKNYGSLEKFITERIKGGAEPLLFGCTPFLYFFEKGLLQEGDIIRINLRGNHIDEHYTITSEGNLEGIEAAGGQYSGKNGTYNPKEILNTKYSDNGWTLCSFAKGRIRLSQR